MTHSMRTGVVVVVLTQGLASCRDSVSSLPPYTPEPLPAPAPSIVSIAPNLGSTDGTTPLVVTGTGFQSRTTVTIGGITLGGRSDHRNVPGTVLYLESPPHTTGAVDVVVTNPDGQAATLVGGYVYAAPGSFDFNGSWGGFGTAGQDIPILFTIEDNRLTSVSCDALTLTLSPPPLVSNGAFSYARPDGVAVSGRIVSATDAVGTLNLASCAATVFVAWKLAAKR